MGFADPHSPSPMAVVTALLVLAGLSLVMVPGGASTDLKAVWLAAEAFSRGDAIYAPATVPFTMSPPEAWITANPGEPVYPYLYPPLWAVLLSPLPGVTSFETMSVLCRLANALMLVGTIVLAWRTVRPNTHWILYLAAGAAGLVLTFVGSLALMENQPQILVSFLVVLSLERLRSGSPVLAGMALALAAALKVYPVILVILWIGMREYRAISAFAVTGAALGLASLLGAGWALHVEFLNLLRSISETALLTPVSYAFSPAVAQLVAPDAFAVHEAPQGGGWLVMVLPMTAGLLAKGLLFLVSLTLAFAMRQSTDELRYRVFWPAALVAVSLLSPLAWAYHYIPALAFAPVLLDRFGARLGGVFMVAALLPMSPIFAESLLALSVGPHALQLAGTSAVLALGALFLSGATSPRKQVAT